MIDSPNRYGRCVAVDGETVGGVGDLPQGVNVLALARRNPCRAAHRPQPSALLVSGQIMGMVQLVVSELVTNAGV
ncbi:hypothetical protein [Streptomyces sp. NPDC058424]|uniref:hypothetical protein n=1 Tax=Streptomyces sp. NPDC058424 TaxID=3346491 RepID=UPI00365FBD5C